MLSILGSSELRRIVVLNPKGGVGKSTLASNLAGYFAANGRKVAIIDMDTQGSSTHWLGRRPAEFPVIHGVHAAPDNPGLPVDFSVTLPAEIELAIVDTPAGIPGEDLARFTLGSHAIIVPVMPSEFDIHAASRLIADLLLEARVSRENQRLGVIANRVKERTIAFKQLMKFLNRLSIPVIGIIRDSQTYVSATREGISIHELSPSQAGKDLKYWESVIEWLEQRLATPLNEKDMLHSSPGKQTVQANRGFSWKFAAAAVFVLFVISFMLWNFGVEPEADRVVTSSVTVDENTQQAVSATELELQTRTEETVTDPVTPPEAEQVKDVLVKDDQVDAQIATVPEADLKVSESQSGAETAELESGSEEPLSPSDELTRKWRFSGVARADGELFAILTDSSGEITRTVTSNVRVDGWRLQEAGPGYAILEKDGEEVRLKFGQ